MRTLHLRLISIGIVTAITAATLAIVTASPAQAYQKKCFSVKSPGEAQSHRECYTPLRRITPVRYQVGYRDSLINRTGRTASLTCEATTSKKFTYGASVTVSGEIKAGIFASIKASATVSVSKEMTSGFATKAGISVPAHSKVLCDRVVYIERFKVRKCLEYYGQSGSCSTLTFRAPSRRGWILTDA